MVSKSNLPNCKLGFIPDLLHPSTTYPIVFVVVVVCVECAGTFHISCNHGIFRPLTGYFSP